MTRTHHNDTHTDKEYATRFLNEGRCFSLRQTITASSKQVSMAQITEGTLLKFQSEPVSIHKDGGCCFPITCRYLKLLTFRSQLTIEGSLQSM